MRPLADSSSLDVESPPDDARSHRLQVTTPSKKGSLLHQQDFCFSTWVCKSTCVPCVVRCLWVPPMHEIVNGLRGTELSSSALLKMSAELLLSQRRYSTANVHYHYLVIISTRYPILVISSSTSQHLSYTHVCFTTFHHVLERIQVLPL